MSAKVKAIRLTIDYKGNLKPLKHDITELEGIRKRVSKEPVMIPVRLDLAGIKSDAVRAAQAYHSELTKAMASVKPAGGGAMSAGGIAIPPGAVQSLRNFATASGAELKRIETQYADSKAKIVKTFEQLERGLAQQTTIRTDKKGKEGKPVVTQIDTKPIEDFKKAMEDINARFGPQLGTAKGSKGDVAALLGQKKQAIDAALTQFAHLEGDPVYQKARNSLISLDQMLAQTAAGQGKRQYKTFAERTIHNDDRKLQADLKLNKGDEAAAKAIQDRIVREKELNRVLNEREALITKQQDRYLNLQRQATAGGHGEAANQFHNAAARMGNDLGQVQLDRLRGAGSSVSQKSEQALERSLNQAVRYNQQQRASLALEEKQAYLIKNRAEREAAINSILVRRKHLLQDTRDRVTDVHAEASRRGNSRLAGKAESTGSTLAQQGIRDMDRLANATTKSTHANSFHSSSLLRNAISFTRWTLAMTAVTAPLAAISSGVSESIKLERAQKTLSAVFRGSKEDAALLAQQTLVLAAANSRDGMEATEAAVAWSRLGLTRTQVLLAVETSLRAANVAEITAAEATAYLTASYKTFHQTILDIPATLDYLNSLSNSNADKVKDMFNAIARGGAVASAAGLSLKEFAAISATVGEATQRPGAEFGNASKSIFNKIRKPDTMEKLKKEFGLDFTTPTGDIQKMSDILGKLAEIYPTLNTGAKTHLTNLIAGSNQSNRAAVMLQTYTTALIAEAVASADSNSAMRENAQILDSVDAKLKAIATTWDSLFVSLGHSGMFDFLKDAISDAETLVKILGSIVPKGTPGKEKDATGRVNSLTSYFAHASAAGGRIADATSGQGLKIGALSEQELRNAAKSFRQFGLHTLADNIDSAFGDKQRASSPADGIIEAQNKIDSLGKLAKGYQGMSGDIMSKSKKQVLSDFDKSLPAYSTLPGGGAAEMLDAKRNLRPIIAGQDKAAASAALQQQADKFAAARAAEAAKLEATRPTKTAEIESLISNAGDKLSSLEAEKLNALGDPEKIAKVNDEISKTNDYLRDLQEAYDKVTKKADAFALADPFADQKKNLTEYIDQLKQAGGIFGETLAGFGNTGFSDLDTKLKIGGARVTGDMFQQALDAATEQNGGNRAEAQRTLDIYNSKSPNEHITPEMTSGADDAMAESLKGQIALYDEINNSLDEQGAKIREATQAEITKLEIAGQAARLAESYRDGSDSAKAFSPRYAIGRSEGEKLLNQTRGIMGDLGGSLSTTPSDPTGAARQLGELTERLSSSKAGILSIEDRMNRAIAERANLEYEISDQAVKQREERTKSLALASREDQLRAAAASAFLKNNGRSGFSMSEFQYFSQESRNAISNLNPQSVKGLDYTERDNNESRSKLDSEIALLAVSLGSLRESFNTLRPNAETKGGALGLQTRPNVENPNLSKENLKLNLTTGSVNLNFDIAPHLPALANLLGPRISAEVGAAMAKLQRDVAPAPNTSAAAGVR